MIKYYSKKLGKSPITELPGYEADTWVDVESPSKEELGQLEKIFNIDARFINEALDASAMPQVTKLGSIIYMCVRYPYQKHGEVVTQPLVFAIGKGLLITISGQHSPVYDKFLKNQLDFTTSELSKLGLLLFSEISHEYEKYINQIGRKIEAIRLKLRGQIISDNDFVDFVIIEGQLNEFETIMSSTGIALKSIASQKNLERFEKYQDIAQEVELITERALTNCRLYEKSISSIRDAYSTLSSNKLNQTMKVLTIATLFVALPTSVYSMYGMNVTLPLANQPWSFAFIVLVSLSMPLAIIVLARRRRLL